MTTRALCALLACGLGLAGGWARADYAPFQGYVDLSNDLGLTLIGNQALEASRRLNEEYAREAAQGKGGKAAAPATRIQPSARPSAPRALAARYAAAQRPELERVFGQTYQAYQQLEEKLGLARGDVAGAVAAYVAGNYMALRDVEVPDAHFQALVGQLRALLERDAAFTGASAERRRELYEQLAIVGTFMAGARLALQQQGQGAAQREGMRRAARANLALLFREGVDRLQIDAAGLALR